MPEKFSVWDAADYIETPEDARLYLEACIDEDPGDGSLVRAALGSIARAQKNMSALARDIEVDRSTLYRALSEEGNPSFVTISRIINALGLQIRIAVKDEARSS